MEAAESRDERLAGCFDDGDGGPESGNDRIMRTVSLLMNNSMLAAGLAHVVQNIIKCSLEVGERMAVVLEDRFSSGAARL